MQDLSPGAYILGTIIVVFLFILATILLTSAHKERMARIERDRDRAEDEKLQRTVAKDSAALISVQQELAELKSMLHEQMIANDNLSRSPIGQPDVETIRERLSA